MVPFCMIIGELLTLLLYDTRRPPRRFLVCNQKKIAGEKDFWSRAFPKARTALGMGLSNDRLDSRPVLGASGAGVKLSDMFGLFPASFCQVKRNFLPLFQGGKVSLFDRGNVDKHVMAAVGWLNESVSLGGVEPFHGSLHSHYPISAPDEVASYTKSLNKYIPSRFCSVLAAFLGVPASWSRRIRCPTMRTHALKPSFKVFPSGFELSKCGGFEHGLGHRLRCFDGHILPMVFVVPSI